MNEQNCAVLLTDTQEVKLFHCNAESDIFDIARDAIGCEWIEIVEADKLAKDGMVLLIDEEGKLKSGTAYINCIASHLYESEKHGDPIIGHAVLVKAEDEDLHLLTEAEAKAVCNQMLQLREKSIDSIAHAFHLMPSAKKHNEIRDEINRGGTVGTTRRQPCADKVEER